MSKLSFVNPRMSLFFYSKILLNNRLDVCGHPIDVASDLTMFTQLLKSKNISTRLPSTPSLGRFLTPDGRNSPVAPPGV
jgi:hypothetical protein